MGLSLLTACSGTDGSSEAGSSATSQAARPTDGSGTDPGPTSGPAETPGPAGSGDPTAVPPADAEPCPTAYDTAAEQPWVPAPPTTQTEARLAPDADPVEVVLCRYDAVTTGPAALDGPPVRIGSDLLSVRTDLQVPPAIADGRPCTPTDPRVPYLARLSYADGDLWVSSALTGNRCAPTGNGVFVSGSSRGAQLAASYEAGAWVSAVGS